MMKKHREQRCNNKEVKKSHYKNDKGNITDRNIFDKNEVDAMNILFSDLCQIS